MNGWVNLYKPRGISSARAVGVVKKLIDRQKIGHTGTLDPEAEGILPLAIGEATKLVQFLIDSKKEYQFTVKFGAKTSSGDVEGDIIATTSHIPLEKECYEVCQNFIGHIKQIPPIFSAIKVNGVRAYKIARENQKKNKADRLLLCKESASAAEMEDRSEFNEHEILPSSTQQLLAENVRQLASGEDMLGAYVSEDPSVLNVRKDPSTFAATQIPLEVELPPRMVQIYNLQCLNFDAQNNTATYVATVSKGTYIRTLAEDIALSLQSLGFVIELRRIQVGMFGLSNSLNLSELEDKEIEEAKLLLKKKCLKIETILDDIPVLDILEQDVYKIKCGQEFITEHLDFCDQIWTRYQGNIVAIGRAVNHRFISSRVFNI